MHQAIIVIFIFCVVRSDIHMLISALSKRRNMLESQRSSLTNEEDPHSWNNMKGDIISDIDTCKSDLDDIRKLVIKLQSQLA